RSEMLWSKFENPMLGIYVVLLHLRKKSVDTAFICKVLENLLGLVGDLPDVFTMGWALALRYRELQEEPFFKHYVAFTDLANPPMLSDCWALLVEATTLRAELVPPDSFSDRMAPQLLSGCSWVTWHGDASEPDLAKNDFAMADARELEPIA